MSAAVAQFPPRFVRRTSLAENEYRVNFKQLDNDVIKTLVSQEARAVTPQMSTIYLCLLSAPQHCWEREGVLYFSGEDRAEGHLTAWEQMREIVGVANSTLSKALDWMHKTGVIGYDARANGAGIRVFFNRASASIRSKPSQIPPAQKILRFPPTPSASVPTPTVGVGFKEDSSEINREITFRASAREEFPPVNGDSATAVRTEPPVPNLRPSPAQSANPDAALIATLTKQVAAELRSEIGAAIERETDNTRQWFLNHGLPKATRVAQRETYNLLRAHGVIVKKSDSGDVGRNTTAGQGRELEQGREGESEEGKIAAFLAETSVVIRQAADANASEKNKLNDACRTTERELRELRDQVMAGGQFAVDEIENRLTAIEDRLAEAMWEVAGPAHLEAALKSARAEMRDYAARMEREAFEDAVRRRVTNSLREQYGIPRIGLFYI
jgi:hypothetical protein